MEVRPKTRSITSIMAALLGAAAANGVSLGAANGSVMRKAARQWTGSPLIPQKWRNRSKYQPHYGEQAAARNRSRM